MNDWIHEAVARHVSVAGVLGVTLGIGCASTRPSIELPEAIPVSIVRAPRGGEADATSTLNDGRVSADGWYCTYAPAPQRFEYMLSDPPARPVRAIGIVTDNVGPNGLGVVTVRVQVGHGVAATGRTFRARVAGTSRGLRVIDLPEPVTGDHVVLSVLRRSRWNTASCFAELMAFEHVPVRANLPIEHVAAEPEPESDAPAAASPSLQASTTTPTTPASATSPASRADSAEVESHAR